jgi:hypothetical protein
MKKFAAPAAVRGSRIAEIVEANSLHFFASRMSNSRYVWEDVPRRYGSGHNGKDQGRKADARNPIFPPARISLVDVEPWERAGR